MSCPLARPLVLTCRPQIPSPNAARQANWTLTTCHEWGSK